MNQELTNNPFNPLTPPKVFDEIKVSLASPERILSWSYGEIKKPEPSTIGLSSPSVMACSAHVSLARSKITNVCAVNISA